MDLDFSIPDDRRRDVNPGQLGGVIGMTHEEESTDENNKIKPQFLSTARYHEKNGLLGSSAQTNVWTESLAPEFFSPESCPPSIDIAMQAPPDKRESTLSGRSVCVTYLTAIPSTGAAYCGSLATSFDSYCAGCSGSGPCAFVAGANADLANHDLAGSPCTPATSFTSMSQACGCLNAFHASYCVSSGKRTVTQNGPFLV